ncbi:MAG: hypothetical protein DMF87_07745 [Acidobacteria bacterium]|nr:MAG: hypothetical protein DMF87_07745 [Acidobacteriota bacterium]
MKIAVTLASLLLFVVLATANGAGYRYGVSDEAAYVPAVMLAENPAAFPHDASLIRTQGQFFIFDDIMGGIGRATGTSLESLFLAAYLISIAAVWIGVVLLGRQLYQSVWLAIAFGALITLRHHIPRTSVNSLEPYFQARVLAFGIGIAAVAMFLRQRQMAAVALVALAGFCHATTGLWFAILIGTALMILDRRWRMPGAVVIAVAVISLVWRMATGPSMDPIWIEALGGRDFIFANEWPLSAWLTNVGFLAALWATHAVRVRRGTATSFDAALVWGATALVALFMLTLPSVAAHVALAVQFQFSRVFWIVDLLLAIYVIAAIGETLRGRQAMMFALVLLAVSAARGAYVMTQEHAERSLFQVSLPESPWVEAMHWLASRPLNAHVLADPGHAFKYGLSVRVASGRDVLLEDDKDAAVAMYSRAIAGRVVDRRRALADFPSLTAARARALAAQYDLDYLVTEATLPLPEVYRNAQFRIYALKPGGPAS